MKLKRKKLNEFVKEYIVYIILIIIWIMATILVKNFFTLYNLITLFIVSAGIIIVSLGQNIVILTGGIDLSVGSIISLATALASILMSFNLPLAILLTLGSGFILGLFNGIFIAKLDIEPFIVTLASMGIAAGLALYLRPAPGGYISPDFIKLIFYNIKVFGTEFPIVCFLIIILTTIVGEIILMRTNIGRMIYAIGGNETFARFMGVPVDKIKIIVYSVSGFTAALTGLYLAALSQVGSPFIGDPYTLYSIIAVTLGGTSISGGSGRYINTVGAVFIIASLERLINQLGIFGIMGSWFTWIFEGILLIVVILISIKVTKK
ncbi:MAG: ABC transporter permease [Nitrososphaeria archaeon]